MTLPFRGPGPDPRLDRFRPLARVLRLALVLTAVLAAGTLVLPGRAGTAVGWAAVGVVVGVPLVRAGWFAVRWFRRGDDLFAWVAVGVLAIVASGVVLAGF